LAGSAGAPSRTRPGTAKSIVSAVASVDTIRLETRFGTIDDAPKITSR
jgi:hypothetical protein